MITICSKNAGIFKTLFRFLFDFSTITNVNDMLKDNIFPTLFELHDSVIDFLPAEMMKGDKITS